jgi:FkbM family methyltransferase
MGFTNTIRHVLNHPLAKRRKAAALARYLRWQIGSRLVPGAVVCEWVNGSRFLVGRGETGMTGNVYSGLQEFEDMVFVLHGLRPGDLFVDIGANVGAYTILACAAAGASGIAFEPVPDTFRRLMDNVRLNSLEPRVRCFNTALACSAGRVAFTAAAHGAMNHVVADWEHTADTTTVETVSLDDALEGAAPFMLKIDVEGYETPVLRGGQRTFADPRLQAVIMELNESGVRYGFKDADLMSMMRDHGFSPCRYEPFSRRLDAVPGGKTGSGNVVFVRDIELVSGRIRSAAAIQLLGVSL